MYKNFFKRLIDFCAAFVAFVILFIPCLVLTIALAVAIKGFPFFFQPRPGKGGKVFNMIKFKTMTDERDADGNLLPDIDRVTKVGLMLRKTSLDELPELLNVLKGDMAIVGPRPLLVRYLPIYTEREQRRHEVRPGITGLAQVSGRHLLSWDERLETDVRYVENLTFALDLKIIFNTFIKVAKQEDVLAVSSEVMPDFDAYRKQHTT
jgi:undecaprenyl phosphate N,N'-diacetylbacillosamine 1-phosphate transferase